MVLTAQEQLAWNQAQHRQREKNSLMGKSLSSKKDVTWSPDHDHRPRHEANNFI